MPYVKLPDGTNIFVESNDPQEIAKKTSEAQRKKNKSRGSDSVVGDIGRGIAAGVVSIPQGLATIPTTGIDLLFDTDVTDDVNDFFESFKPDVGGTAGQTAQLITQFGIPGIGVASALSKLTKLQQLGSIAAVDAAVATDDVDTFTDMLFDKESDEERLRTLQGRDAALARLTERLQVFGETAAVMYAAPVAVSGAVKGVGAGLDLAAPYMSALAKATVGDGSQGVAMAAKADKSAVDYIKKFFRYGGKYEQTAANNKLIADVMQAKMLYTANLVNPINDSMKGIRQTIESAASNGGKLNDDDALKLTKAIATYRAPLIAVEREFPELVGTAKKNKMIEYQNDAMKTVESFEGSGNKIDYEALGISKENQISNVLKRNQGAFKQEQQLIYDFSDKDPSGTISRLFIPPALREAIGDNIGLYGTTTYRAISDSNYKVPDDLKEAAIREIQEKIPGLESKVAAESAFFKLTNTGQAKEAYQTPEMFAGGITFGQLQGKDLKNLPAVRKAMGEVTALDYSKPGDWRKALLDESVAASETMSKLGSLAGKSKAFEEIRLINDTAEATGRTSFLKTTEELFPDGVITDPTPVIDGVQYFKFGEDMGLLNNTFAPEVFHKALNETSTQWLNNIPAPLQKTYQGLLGLKAISQYGKTILGPTAQIRNNTSVPFMALMNGNLGPSGNFAKNFKLAFAGVFDPKGKAKLADQIKEASEYNLMVGRGTQLQEISDVAAYSTNNMEILEKLKAKPIGEIMTRLKEGPLGIAERAYTGSDNAARLINWSGEQSKLSKVIANSTDDTMIPISAGKNMSDPDIQKFIKLDNNQPVVNVGELKAAGDTVVDKFIKGEAADIALNVTPTYSRVPEIVKELKYIPVIGNFTAFPAEIIRNTVNTMSRGIKELTSNSAELQKVGARRIAGGLTTTVGIPAGLTATALSLTGAEQEQVDAYKRSFAAPWEKTATMIPTGTDAAGNITGFYNFSYTNPYDFLQRPVKAIFNAVSEGERNEANLMRILSDSSFGMIGELLDPFVSPSLGAASVYEATVGKTATGRLIYNESDPLGEKVAKGMLHSFNAVAPTLTPVTFETDADGVQVVPKDFITSVASLGTGTKGVISPKGKPIDVSETLVSAFSGIKVTKPQIDRSLYYKAAEAKRAIRETTNEYNRLLRSSNKREADEFIQGYINTNEARYSSLRTLYTAIEDARKLGLKTYEIDEQLKVARVANRDMVMAGIFKPIEVSDDVLRLAIQKTERKAAQPVPIGDLISTQVDLTGQSLTGKFRDPRVQSTARASEVLRQEEIDKILTGST
tara:strand:+ start:6501 stop:10397 length:3897 start_codon:yes stop_codon:yes gene_type:complete